MSSSSRDGESPAARDRLVVEAFLSLVVARLALRVVPFRWLEQLFVLPPGAAPPRSPERSENRVAVRRAVESAARLLPFETVCFPRAMAAQWMLRRRGIGATLVYGGGRAPGRGLSAHVWVEDEGHAVIGEREAAGMAVLARYTPAVRGPLSPGPSA